MEQTSRSAAANEKRNILRAAGLIGAITLLSRFTGLVRDSAVAAILGKSRFADVFWAAFELSNIVRRVMGEGALSSFVVPLMTERITEKGRESGWRFFNNAANVMGLLALAFTLMGMLFSREVFLLFGGLGLIKAQAEPAFIELGARLTRLMFPFTLGLTVGSVMMGACHTLRRFGAPSMGSVMLNITMIAASGAVIALGAGKETATVWLGWSVLAGAVLRIALMAPTLMRAGWRWRPLLALRDPELRRLFRMMVPGLLAMAISQINLSVSGIFAMYLDAGVNTSIKMAGRLIQFPMALTATAASTAMLPQITQFFLERRHGELRDLLALTKRLEIVLMVPAVIGLMVLGMPIVELVFQRGEWNAEASRWTFSALLFYAPGLMPLGWIRLYEPIFFARHDRVTPLKAAALSVAVNIAMNWVMAFHTPLPRMQLAPAGMAIANTVAAFINYFVLSFWVGRVLEHPLGEHPRIWETFAKSTVAALAACGAGWAIYAALTHGIAPPRGTLTRAAYLMPVIGVVAALHFALVRLLRVPDSERVTEKIAGRLRRMAERKKPSK